VVEGEDVGFGFEEPVVHGGGPTEYAEREAGTDTGLRKDKKD
jgi:hypothetical protein